MIVVKAIIYKGHFLLANLKAILGLILLLVLIPVIVWTGRNVVTLLSRAAVIPANIVIDADKPQGILSRPWMGLSQGGEQEYPGKLVSLSPVSSQIKSLGVSYIRIDHVLEDPFYASYKTRIKEITNSGAIPFIALSYFPKSAATSDVGTVTNWSVWQARVKALVEEISGKDKMNLSGVYYEVWNEPDGPGFGNYSVGGGKDYYPLYQKTLEAILSAQNVNSFKVGGPALADLRRCTNGKLFVCQTFWLDKFLSLVSRDKLRIDFISWHRYSLKMSDYNEDVNFILDIYNKYANLPKIEKIITEWGSDPARNPMHNSVFDAAHLVAAARTFIGHVDMTTKFEVRDGPDSGSQGWGILYSNGAKKPTYEALRLLNLLRSDRVQVTGEGTNVMVIASRDNSGATFVVVNYDKARSNTEKVPIAVNGMTNGKYRLTKYFINNSSPLGKNETTTVSVTDGKYSSVELMLSNTIVLYDFQLLEIM